MFGFDHALCGLTFLFRSQLNARVHACFTIAVIALGAFLQISANDWCWLVIGISMVWCAEALNTAIEQLANRVTTESDPLIKQAKDLSAGAVLITAIGSASIGFIVLGPPLWRRLVP